MKKLIIADLKSFNNQGIQTGHYFSLARNYQELFGKICKVTVAGGPIYKTGFKKEELIQLPHDFIAGDNVLKNKWGTLMNCRHLMQHTSTDDVIVLQMSGATTNFLAILLFGLKKKKIYSIQYDTEALDSPLKRFIYQLSKSKIKGILCPTDAIGKAFELPYCVISDYIYTSDKTDTQTIPFDQKKYDFAIVGRITPEKGVIEAIEKFIGTKYKIVVAGKPSTIEVENKLNSIASSNKNIELHLDFVPDNDFYNYLQKSKYSLMNYQGVYANRSSGVVLDTLFNGTPVIGHHCQALRFIEEEGVGCLFDEISELDLSVSEDQSKYHNCIKAIKKYLNKHKLYKDKLAIFLSLQ